MCDHQAQCSIERGSDASNRALSADRASTVLERRMRSVGWCGCTLKSQESVCQADCQEVPDFSQCSPRALCAQPANSDVVCKPLSPIAHALEVFGLPRSEDAAQVLTNTLSSAKVNRARNKHAKNVMHEPLPVGEITAPTSSKDTPTTMMFGNVACGYSQQDVLRILDEAGFKGAYNCIFLPLNERGTANLSYFFVNFLTPQHASACSDWFQGKVFGPSKTTKICRVQEAYRQGLAAFRLHAHSRKSKGYPLFLNV